MRMGIQCHWNLLISCLTLPRSGNNYHLEFEVSQLIRFVLLCDIAKSSIVELSVKRH